MVYDPIRDCEVPSPSVVKGDPFKYPTPPTGGYDRDRDDASSNGRPSLSQQHSLSYSPPPGGSAGHGPGPSSLRGLLNDGLPPESRRGSERTASVSSIPEEGEDGGSRTHINRLLNNASTQPISKTNSNSSLPRSSPSNPSPGSRQHMLDPNGFLTPATPALAYPRSRSTTSRSPLPGMSPQKPTVPLPHTQTPMQPQMQMYPHGQAPYPHGQVPYPYEHGYPVQYGESSHPQPHRRESSGPPPGHVHSQQRPMLPPQQPIHPHEMYAYEQRTPGGGGYQPLPMRSPSISVSPRSQHQTLPYTSRPGSASSGSHPFGYQPHPQAHYSEASPSTSTRRLSEDQARPTSSSSAGGAGRRYTDSAIAGGPTPVRRSSQTSATGYPATAPRLTPIRSPSPIARGTPYQPKRISQPGSIQNPIEADELAYYKDKSVQNNPLRRKKRTQKPMPSWSGPSSGPKSSSFPTEESNSYFPPQDPSEDRYHRSQSYVDDRASIGRPSVTPTPGSAYGGHGGQGNYPPAFEEPPTPSNRGQLQRGRRPVGNGYDGQPQNHLKRPSDRDEVYYGQGHDLQRRKVSETHYVGNNATVADHYNSRPEVGVEGREFSPIIGLKKFNNWIKSVLIGKFAHRHQGKVLDIGCGKGGDLNKWKQARIMLYVGLDIAETSVQQAAERYQRMQGRFDGFFFAYDCYSKPLGDILPEQLQQKDLYDNVTMQFCMHYAFESVSKVRMMIENVSRYLRKGGVFIGTIPNAELLLSKLNELPEDDPELKFGNSCYFVQFSERRHKGIYGHQYRFFLTDAVEDVPEYVVDWDNFVNLAMEYKLRLVYKKPFHDILQEEKESRDFGPLLGKMGVINHNGESAMDEDQWEAANLYMGFAFEKI
ncbi:uncharacterized protein I303_102782 [Kwoniella dejecticola CBS 10117]|uniref:mRNA cap guanine-N(7) methyltransferase n=1 Tax=Kwoniella dejecticola CBS 10117 TaxID=1296121 RepID=A0A1A6A9P2_9TREE|nr:uncharacterized protein I303_02797 [Kwoniella dejecticola CBS 10117]OBR86782.1 hypothetical protein I303_02797 [Kwoniella dejecticola CBS 10117]